MVHYFWPHIGGMEEVVHAQASSLHRRGHPVTVVTSSHSRGLPRREDRRGFRIHRVRAANFMERRFGVTFPLLGPLAAATVAREVGRAEMVHIHDVFYPTSHAAFLAALVRRKPFFVTQHVALVDHPSRLVMGAQRLVYATVGRAMFRRAQAVVVYNVRVRDMVIALGADPARVVLNHNGIDTDQFSPPESRSGEARSELRSLYGIREDLPVVLFVGRLVPKKGYDLVADAGCAAYTTLVVGEGAGSRPVRGVNVVEFGPADREQLVDLYRLSDVFVFPAVGEMFTLVMQEAMATGLPVVTTDDPAYAEYELRRELIGFVPRDSAAIRAKVQEILASPELRQAMGRYSRQLALERFGWDANYDHEYSVYAPAEAGTAGRALGTDAAKSEQPGEPQDSAGPGEVMRLEPSLAG